MGNLRNYSYQRARRRPTVLSLAFLAIVTPTFAQTPVRVATWNVLSIGNPGSAEFEAALSVIWRIGADVLGVNEISSTADGQNLAALAADTGYPFVLVPSSNPFGAPRNAVISRLPVISHAFHNAPALSGDAEANDISRFFVEVTVDVPGNAQDLTLFSVHLKSGTADSDEFRRACEVIRLSQAISRYSSLRDAYVVLGDMNEQVRTVPDSPNPFRSLPSGLPQSFVLGRDLATMLSNTGFVNNPFHYYGLSPAPKLSVVLSRQVDGDFTTFPSLRLQLDYICVSHRLAAGAPRGEVYDSRDEVLGRGLPKRDDPLPAATCEMASDHLPVFVDLIVPAPASCGDGRCEGAENGCNCAADCGDPGTNESAAGTCRDGMDNDCDGVVDCDDPDCSGSNACPTCGDGVCETGEDCNVCPQDCVLEQGAICGNWICEPDAGEDCETCPSDCRARLGGDPSGRYCCGDGGGASPVGCEDARCNSQGWVCSSGPVYNSCCGDGVCEGRESAANCAADCGRAGSCGDGACTGEEDVCNCPTDCTAPPRCGALDLNCDGAVSSTDVGAFVLALINPQNYSATYPLCDVERADGNGDGSADARDITLFLAAVLGANPP